MKRSYCPFFEASGDRRINLDILNKQAFSDVSFIVGSTQERVNCHKVFLGTRSPVFEVMFADRWRDENPIELPDVEPEDFRSFLEYMYTNQTHFTQVSDVDSMMYLAEKYDVGPLKEKCQNFLKAELDQLMVDQVDVLRVLQIAEKYNLTTISNKARKYVIRNFNSVGKIREFLELSEETLCKVLASDQIFLKEIKIFHHVYRWAVFQCTGKNLEVSLRDPRKFFGRCLKEIRFPVMDRHDLEIVQSYKILTAEETTRILNFVGLSAQDKNNLSSKHLVCKHHPRMTVDLTNDYVFERSRSYGIPKKLQELGLRQEDWVQANKDISVRGLEFLGPIEKNSYYDISVVIKKYVGSKLESESTRMTQQLFGRKGENLRFIFPEPIVIEKSDDDDTFASTRCVIESTITGPPTYSYKTNFIQTGYPYSLKTQVCLNWRSKILARILLNRKLHKLFTGPYIQD